MNRTYQPSGKVSPLFLPAAASTLVLAAAAALLCAFGVQASHATLLDMTIYFAVTGYVAKFGALLCVKCGRVRRPALAKWGGIVLAAWYWFLLAAYSMPVKAVLEAEKSPWIWKWDGAWKEALARLPRDGDFWEPVFSLKDTGAAITGKSGNILFTVPGAAYIMLLIILFFAAAAQFGLAFWKQGRAPFCEVSGKWAKETVVELQYQTEEACLSRLLLGDTTVLAELEPPGGGEADRYLKVSIFAADRSAAFYVSVSKMTRVDQKKNKKKDAENPLPENVKTPDSVSHSDAKTKRRKKPVFEEERLAEYLELDRGTGLLLLSRSRMEAAKKGACI